MIEQFKPKQHIETLKNTTMEDLEWNLKEEETKLKEMLQNGGEIKSVEETYQIIDNIKKELEFRVENN
jgi:hypothetical protein